MSSSEVIDQNARSLPDVSEHSSNLIDDKTIAELHIVRPKNFFARYDTTPFFILYGIFYYIHASAETELWSLTGLIAIPITIFLHAIAALLGYWSIPLRLKIAYVPVSMDTLLDYLYRHPDAAAHRSQFHHATQLAANRHEAALASYNFHKQLHEKKCEIMERHHAQALAKWTPSSGRPKPELKPMEPPAVPHPGLPPLTVNGEILSIAVVPIVNHGSPVLVELSLARGDADAGEARADIDPANAQFTIAPGRLPPVTFSHHYHVYSLRGDRGVFVPLEYPDLRLPAAAALPPLADAEADALRTKFGLNTLTVPIPAFLTVLAENAMAPFFVFQVFCVCLWMLDEYWYYSLFTLAMLVLMECTVVWRRLSHIKDMLGPKPAPPPPMVCRAGVWARLPAAQLVPGDTIAIEAGGAPCDALLLSGACVVDEALLTGESVPQVKEGGDGLDAEDTPDPDQKRHTVFAGTQVLDVKRAAEPRDACPAPPVRAAVALVARTGFGTVQGSLVRTILASSSGVPADMEALGFIGVLLVVAVIAAYQVLVEGLADPTRSRYKLLLNVIMIVTSVVPPELPMQLSLAVNNALLALSKNRIFCTEPHRIPMAGAVDVVCFDKTGTLTSDSFHVAALLAAEDVAKPLPSPLPKPAAAVAAAPEHSRLVLAACHELSVMTKDAETTLLGDPLEAAAFEAVGARFVAPLSGRDAVLVDSRESVVLQRFPFASSKRRMTAVVAVRPAHGPALQVVTKGAPEALYPLLDPAHRPDADAYAATCSALAHKGLRVLALAWRPLKLDKAGRPLPGLEPAAAAAAADLTFEAAVRAGALQTCPQAVAEDGLRFAGLVAFASPLKRDSREVVAELRESGHRVIMITGDHVQTAASVARELDIVDRPLLTLAADEAGVMTWIDDQGKARAALDPAALGLPDDCDFAITGDTLAPLSAAVHAHAASPALAQVALGRLFLRVSVFARAVPKDKEAVIRYLRAAGSTCVMCGDGTNDVGALRTAEIGIALLSRERVAVPEAAELTEDQKREAEDELIARTALNNSSVAFMQRQMATLRAKGDHARVAMLRKQVLFLCEAGQEEVTLRPGDASIAAPFTAKHASARCVRDLLLQGRCALVTTMQMYQILAINCLIAAYHMSALFLKGVKTGEAQMTIQGMVVAGCFFMLSRGAPLDKLHPQRPHARIFSKWMLATVSLQFVIHLATLKAASDMAEPFIDHTTVPGIMAYDEDADTDAHGIPIEREAALPTATATTKPAAKPAAVTGAALDAAVSEGMHTVELDAALLREIEEETTEKPAEPKKGAFVPNVLNTTLYLVQTAMTAATFLANYRGWPFMTPLREHAALYKTLLFTVVGCALAALEVFPDINAQLELVPLPSTDYSLKLCALIVVDVVLATAVGQLLMRLCAQGPKHEPRTKLKVD